MFWDYLIFKKFWGQTSWHKYLIFALKCFCFTTKNLRRNWIEKIFFHSVKLVVCILVWRPFPFLKVPSAKFIIHMATLLWASVWPSCVLITFLIKLFLGLLSSAKETNLKNALLISFVVYKIEIVKLEKQFFKTIHRIINFEHLFFIFFQLKL